MKKLAKFFGVLAVTFFVAGFTSAAVVDAHDGEHEQAPVAEESSQNNEENHDDHGQFTYVAQTGDSYTEIARKAVQTYGIVHNVELSGAQIIFAETNLTQDADAPLLNEGEEVKFEEDTIKAIVEKAQTLDEATVAAWESYVPFVDFNTDAVGETQQ